VQRGQIFGLIGPNGSGKSTSVNLICGNLAPTAGRILLDGEDITDDPVHVRVEKGIARTFQNIRLFEDLTVWQNLWVALGRKSGESSTFFGRWFSGAGEARREIGRVLEFCDLDRRSEELAGNLSFGEQRRLELARALVTRPKLLLLDEPAAGMNREEIFQLDDRLRDLNRSGMTIVLVEHHMELVMGVTDRIAVLNFGGKIAEGSPAEVQRNAAVCEAYLGGSVEGIDTPSIALIGPTEEAANGPQVRQAHNA
jgi:ABC-type branched-subunit amino acid transport system ATPase component